MRHLNFPSILTIVFIVSISTSPSFALGADAKNLLLIGIMGLSPLILLYFLKFSKKDIYIILLMLTLILFPFLHHPESIRWVTMLYGWAFCASFMGYKVLINQSNLSVNDYLTCIKWLLYAYCIVLLIQQFCVLTGLPIFALGNYNPRMPWKLNSLTSEPSHSVRYIALLMFCYLTMRELLLKRKYNLKIDLKEDKWIWTAFLWSMITSVSGTAFLFLLIILLKFLNLKNIYPIIAVAVLLFILVNLSGTNKSFNRAEKVALATLTLDEGKIVKADHSGSTRIVPMIICAKMIDLTTADGWFGHGVDYVSTKLYKLFPGVVKGYSGGGVFLLGVEYGIISFILFIIISFSATVRRGDIITILFWVFMCLNEGLNMQLTWAAIFLLYTNKVFINSAQNNLTIKETSK